MSNVVVDVDEQVCDELMYGYQMIQDDDGMYKIWVSTGPVRGHYVHQDIESFVEAFDLLNKTILEREGV